MHLPFEKRFPSELNRDHDYYMSHAYNQALLAWEKDEVPIGAVIAHEGVIIASAYNQTRSTNDRAPMPRCLLSQKPLIISGTGG